MIVAMLACGVTETPSNKYEGVDPSPTENSTVETAEPIHASTPATVPLAVHPDHVRLGVAEGDIGNAFKWCGLYQDAARFEGRMLADLEFQTNAWSRNDIPPSTLAQVIEILSQETRYAIDLKWESVQPHMDTMVRACDLVDAFCSLQPPPLLDVGYMCDRFYGGRLPRVK